MVARVALYRVPRRRMIHTVWCKYRPKQSIEWVWAVDRTDEQIRSIVKLHDMKLCGFCKPLTVHDIVKDDEL